MDNVYDLVCGLDVHKDIVVACMMRGSLDLFNPSIEIREFGTLFDDLAKLGEWIEKEGCRHVAMESTGVYWIPVYESLEGAFGGDIDIKVVNPRHMHAIKGKKSDKKDAKWIATLLRADVLKGSFVPPRGIRDLRSLTRHRDKLVKEKTMQKNRIEKHLQTAGFKISSFITDIFGASGRGLINRLISRGTLEAEDVKASLKGRTKAKFADIRRAVNGTLSECGRRLLSRMMSQIDGIKQDIEDIESDIAEQSAPYSSQIALLQTFPGIGLAAARAIIAEIGVDMGRFESAGHICSWAGLCPGENESAGKRKSTRILHGNSYVKSVLCECAWSAVRSKGCFLSRVYYGLSKRKGGKKAIMAVARRMLAIIYCMLRDGKPYDESLHIRNPEKDREKKVLHLAREASKLGFYISPQYDPCLDPNIPIAESDIGKASIPWEESPPYEPPELEDAYS